MKLSVVLCLLFFIGCQSSESNKKQVSESNKNQVSSTLQKLDCDKEICLQLSNHNIDKKSFDVYLKNTTPVAGFQCDLPGVKIVSSEGGLLKENEYQTSNSDSRILSFSMQAKLIPAGEGLLTTITYSDPTEEVCMTKIIFAGVGGEQLKSNDPECLKLK
tara:strand:- start:2 stop:481 length:480 start_codon:yes stop_codon:yes gene_type:complete